MPKRQRRADEPAGPTDAELLAVVRAAADAWLRGEGRIELVRGEAGEPADYRFIRRRVRAEGE